MQMKDFRIKNRRNECESKPEMHKTGVGNLHH